MGLASSKHPSQGDMDHFTLSRTTIRTDSITPEQQISDISQIGIYIRLILSILQQYHMYNPFFLFYHHNLALPTFSSPPHLQGLPCSLFTYNQLCQAEPIRPNLEIEPGPASEQCSSVKEEEVSSKYQSQTQNRPSSRFKYAKKNVQSNVVNQCFSYLTTRSKSYCQLSKILKSEEKIQAFYEIMKQGKKKHTKYMGRSVLQNLLQLEDDHPMYILHKKLRYKVSLKIVEIRLALRVMTRYFLRNLIVPTILTSNKMDKSTIKQHLDRVRDIQRYLDQTPPSSF